MSLQGRIRIKDTEELSAFERSMAFIQVHNDLAYEHAEAACLKVVASKKCRCVACHTFLKCRVLIRLSYVDVALQVQVRLDGS